MYNVFTFHVKFKELCQDYEVVVGNTYDAYDVYSEFTSLYAVCLSCLSHCSK